MSDALMPTYARTEIMVERGEGPYLIGTDGRRYLDFAGGIAVNALGHSHPHLVEALRSQAEKLWHCSNLYRIPDGERLAERLCANSFADRVFFCNSGAEAVEGALKLARKYHHSNGQPERTRVITCSGAFHGRTLTTLSAAGNPKYLAGFGPASEGFDQVAFGNLNELRTAVSAETAAILVEPIQGEGGIRVASEDFLRGLRQTADEFDLLLIFDEIQCGMGRTGKLFAYEWAGIAPDVVASAKGLGGGFPVGAFMATEKAAKGMVAGTHGSTFGGNPLAMAVGNAVLDVILAEGFLDQVTRTGEQLRSRIEDLAARHPGVIEEVRGKGLMLGVKLHGDQAAFVSALRDQGLLVVGAAENVIRLVPPMIIDESHVNEALAALETAAAAQSQAA